MQVACDGHASADGKAAWAFVCGCGTQGSGRLPDHTPSHLAEWAAVQRALAHLEGHGPGRVVLRVDSALVVKGLAARRPAMRGEAAEVRAACRQALARLARLGLMVDVQRVRREDNAEADAMARRAAGP
jgi:ribonuclease HI